jgi:ABC-type sugar transport system permease subunit
MNALRNYFLLKIILQFDMSFFILIFDFLSGLAFITIMAQRRSLLGRIIRSRQLYFFLLPTFVLLGVFSYYPFFSALVHAFFDWDGFNDPVFIGLRNFVELFTSDMFFSIALKNMVFFMIAGVFISITVPLATAELIHHLWSEKAKYVLRVLFIIPMVIPGIVGLQIWQQLLAGGGFINKFLEAVGLEAWKHSWLGDTKTVIPAMIFMGFPWAGGVNLLLYLAGLMNVPNEIYDAAVVDGATGWKRIWKIDLPLLKGQMKLILVLSILGTIQGYEGILILTDGGPGTASLVPGLHLFHVAFGYGRLGYGSAIGTMLFVLSLILTIINMKYLRSSVEYEA